ncbi:MAG: type II secretion system protein GspJ [Fimbriimonadaceae bacterium]|nr:type II secretion system protein GspJ [Fimbriimonadaceae bacterium]
MTRRGLTLIELIIAIAGMVILTLALSAAYSAALGWQSRSTPPPVSPDLSLEQRVRNLLRTAFITSDEADTGSYFIGNSSTNDSASSDTLTFVRLPDPPDRAYRAARIEDSTTEDLNDRFGVQGAPQEVSLSPVGIGDAPTQEGFFLRIQSPSDGDPTQGGRQSVLDENLASVRFEFFDGQDWQPTWDTQETGFPRRLPSAVRMTYTRPGEDAERVATFPVPNSDATPDNPAIPQTEEGA